jgi:hypothetical protein
MAEWIHNLNVRLTRFSRELGSMFPHFKRRRWRYVSTGRHLRGLLVLVLLLVVLHIFWIATNATQIRKRAIRYLEDLTGAHVTVGEANFDFFQGVRLSNIQLFLSEDDDEAFFEAPEVVLIHRPGALLVGRFEPVEVVLIEPSVVVEYDSRTGRYAFQDVFNTKGSGAFSGTLPRITVNRATLRPQERSNLGLTIGESSVWNVRFIPEGTRYRIWIDQQDVDVPGPPEQLVLNVRTGEIEEIQMTVDESIARALPAQYARRLEAYEASLVGSLTTDDSTGERVFSITKGSLVLPPEQGGLELAHISGRLRMVEEGDDSLMVLEDVVGQISNSPGSSLRLGGETRRIDGVWTFDIALELTGFSIPDPNPAQGWMGDLLDSLIDEYQPEGQVDIVLNAQGDAEGNVTYSGVITPRSLSVCYKHFPMVVGDVEGMIAFSEQGVDQFLLQGLVDEAMVEITGEALRREGFWAYDVEVRATDVPFDDAVREALPRRFDRVWEELNPTGRVSAYVHATRGDDAEKHLDVVLNFRNRASMTYAGFPYPLETLFGSVAIRGEEVIIGGDVPVIASSGSTRFEFTGLVTGLHDDLVVDLEIDAYRLPIDETFLAALPEEVARRIRESMLVGQARHASARIIHSEGQTDYNVQARLADVSFQVPEFPLPIRQAQADVTITHDRLFIKRLQGLHNDSPLTISGQIQIGRDPAGVDLEVTSPRFEAAGALAQALPPNVREVYDMFHPRGYAAMAVWFRRDMPDQAPGQVDYRLVIQPDQMQFQYDPFPYTFRGVTGQIVITPGLVQLTDITSAHDGMTARLDGNIQFAHGVGGRRLTLAIDNAPIDAELLAAMPPELAPLVEQVIPGGMCSVNLVRLDFERAEPTEETPEPLLEWFAQGTIRVDGAQVALGMDPKTIDGSVQGMAGRDARGLAISADMLLDRVAIGPREVTNITARMRKAYASRVLHIENLVGYVHGGRLAGFAELLLDDPLEYGVNLAVEDVDLNALFNAGIEDPAERVDVEGTLSGTVEYVAETGGGANRRASGLLRVTEGSMVRMPVMLGMMHVLTLQLPGDTVFTDAVMTYHLQGNRMVFEEIDLLGPTLGAVGSGTLNLATDELNILFLAGPPGESPRLLGLEEFVENVVREVAEIQITGTLANPQTQQTPLRGLDEALNRLLHPE